MAARVACVSWTASANVNSSMSSPYESPESRLPTDEGFLPTERFPRQLDIAFRANDRFEMTIHLVHAEPNAFPDGPIENYPGSGKRQGFAYGQIGDALTDRTFNPDDHYGSLHDAMHIGVLTATGGWSPVLRQLLGLRRYSDFDTKEIADGPLAVLAEEQILSSYRVEMLREGPIPSTIGSISVAAAAQVRDLLPPGTEISPEVWQDALELGGTLMFLLESMGARTNPDSAYYLHVDLDARDIHLTNEEGHAQGHKGASVRKLVKTLRPPDRRQFRKRYGTFMGVDGEGQPWYLQY